MFFAGYLYPGLLAGRLPLAAGTNLGLQAGLPGLASLMPILVLWCVTALYLTRLWAKEAQLAQRVEPMDS